MHRWKGYAVPPGRDKHGSQNIACGTGWGRCQRKGGGAHDNLQAHYGFLCPVHCDVACSDTHTHTRTYTRASIGALWGGESLGGGEGPAYSPNTGPESHVNSKSTQDPASVRVADTVTPRAALAPTLALSLALGPPPLTSSLPPPPPPPPPLPAPPCTASNRLYQVRNTSTAGARGATSTACSGTGRCKARGRAVDGPARSNLTDSNEPTTPALDRRCSRAATVDDLSIPRLLLPNFSMRGEDACQDGPMG